MYFNYKSSENLPIKLTQNIAEKLLKSDSSHRFDVKLRADMKME